MAICQFAPWYACWGQGSAHQQTSATGLTYVYVWSGIRNRMQVCCMISHHGHAPTAWQHAMTYAMKGWTRGAWQSIREHTTLRGESKHASSQDINNHESEYEQPQKQKTWNGSQNTAKRFLWYKWLSTNLRIAKDAVQYTYQESAATQRCIK